MCEISKGTEAYMRLGVDNYVQELDVEEFITHNLPFARINEAFKLLLVGDCLRTVLHFNDTIQR